MIRGWLAAGTLAAVVVCGCQRYERDDDGDVDEGGERFAHPEPDSRVRHSGTHRAGPAELAARDRIAAAESAKLAAKAFAERPSVPATSWSGIACRAGTTRCIR